VVLCTWVTLHILLTIILPMRLEKQAVVFIHLAIPSTSKRCNDGHKAKSGTDFLVVGYHHPPHSATNLTVAGSDHDAPLYPQRCLLYAASPLRSHTKRPVLAQLFVERIRADLRPELRANPTSELPYLLRTRFVFFRRVSSPSVAQINNFTMFTKLLILVAFFSFVPVESAYSPSRNPFSSGAPSWSPVRRTRVTIYIHIFGLFCSIVLYLSCLPKYLPEYTCPIRTEPKLRN
jgi:hypothetical protein